MQDFSVKGSPAVVWGGSDFRGPERNFFLLGKALKFRGIFRKYALKLIKI